MDENLVILIDRVQALKNGWPDLAREAGVSYSWLCKFGQGHIQNPTFKHLVRLRSALDARERQAA